MVSLNWWDIEIIEKANERIYQERESKKKKDYIINVGVKHLTFNVNK